MTGGRFVPAMLCALAAALLLVRPAAAELVRFALPDGTALTAHWYRAAASGPAPAVVALHGCGGLYRRDGKTLEGRYSSYARRFREAGFHVLLPDSLTDRGVRQICTTARAERAVDVEMRRGDAIAALQWLAARADVDAARLALVGWSHGGTTALSAINSARRTHAQPLAAAAVFYPGCGGLLKSDFATKVALLVLLGEKDDWTPPDRCVALVERFRSTRPAVDPTLRVYPDSYHGFDGTSPVRFRSDVPNGVQRRGVHQGGNPAARAAALLELDAFLARVAGKPGAETDQPSGSN
jgi:dienelactone hydrolase